MEEVRSGREEAGREGSQPVRRGNVGWSGREKGAHEGPSEVMKAVRQREEGKRRLSSREEERCSGCEQGR